MTSVEIGLLGLGLLLAMIAMRVPIGVALIAVSFLGIWALVGERAAWGVLRAVPYNFTASWTLSSVPMFLLMGFICYHSGLTRGLFDAPTLGCRACPAASPSRRCSAPPASPRSPAPRWPAPPPWAASPCRR